ncbi:unnamed protein product [Spirodela intermedia]|uniref:Uncharacterized protein n=1 Tax=Spirodela intermedia TaxID=51605 RepID=A0A7I8J774_SPIIN|nr:unnamed protein product [Spirodela intermedia]CAA6665914.1 unnamed protein product [Spirodela intermedia]
MSISKSFSRISRQTVVALRLLLPSHTLCPASFLSIFPRPPIRRELQRRRKQVFRFDPRPLPNLSTTEEEWLKKLPDKKKPSTPQPSLRRGVAQKPGLLSEQGGQGRLYLKIGPGNLDKDVERRFSYALSREDIEMLSLAGRN